MLVAVLVAIVYSDNLPTTTTSSVLYNKYSNPQSLVWISKIYHNGFAQLKTQSANARQEADYDSKQQAAEDLARQQAEDLAKQEAAENLARQEAEDLVRQHIRTADVSKPVKASII